MTGTFVKTIGKSGKGRLRISNPRMDEVVIRFDVIGDEKQ